MKEIFNWIARKRLLDGYLAILNFIIFYQLIALYGHTVTLIGLTLSVPHPWELLALHIDYHGRDRDFPPITVSFKLFNHKWVDTGAKAMKALSDRVDKIMAEYRAEQAEEKRLAMAAREAGL